MFGKSRKTEKERKEKEYGEKDREKKVIRNRYYSRN